jgi:hypothetical protein
MPKELSYGRTNVGSMRRALDSGKKMFEEEYTLSSGAHILRILPPRKDGPFFYEFMLHYLPGGIKVICPSTFNKPCPICSLGNKLFKSDEPQEVAQGKKLYHRKAYLANAVDCRQAKGVNVLRMGKNLISDLIELFGDENDPEDEGVDFTDPSSNGANIRIKVIMNEGDFPRYLPKIVKTGVAVPYKNWLKDLLDLPKLVEGKLLSQKELAAMVADVDFGEEEEDNPKPRRTGKTQESDEDDDDDKDKDEDDDENTDSDDDEDGDKDADEDEEGDDDSGDEDDDDEKSDPDEDDDDEKSDDDDDDEGDEDEEEEEKQAPKKGGGKKPAPAPAKSTGKKTGKK